MIPTFLVAGQSACAREQAIAEMLQAHAAAVPLQSSILSEGLSDGKSPLQANDQITITRIAAGCLCCSNNMIMRIYLNRLIRQKPQQLFLSLSTDAHLDQIQQYLTGPDYLNRLELKKVLNLNLIVS